jgi:hypothetical protein
MDMSLMDSNSIHRSSAENRWRSTKTDSGRPIILTIPLIPNEFGHGTSPIGNFISLP